MNFPVFSQLAGNLAFRDEFARDWYRPPPGSCLLTEAEARVRQRSRHRFRSSEKHTPPGPRTVAPEGRKREGPRASFQRRARPPAPAEPSPS